MKVLVSAVLMLGCSQVASPPSSSFQLEFRAVSEEGTLLPGASFALSGGTLGSTNADGREELAHVLLRPPCTEKSVQLGIDTMSRPTLKPISPTGTYELHRRDAIVPLEPSFVLAARPAPRNAPRRPHIPVRVD